MLQGSIAHGILRLLKWNWKDSRNWDVVCKSFGELKLKLEEFFPAKIIEVPRDIVI